MAASSKKGLDEKDNSPSNADLLLHPELLSQEFIKMILHERNIDVGDGENRDGLTDLYLRHVIPLPQRALPNNRWGKKMEKTRSRQTPVGERSHSSSNDHNRKRPPIVFDSSSSHSGPIKLKKAEGVSTQTGLSDRLKPPPGADLSNPIRKLSSTTPYSPSSSHRSVNTGGSASYKREAEGSILKGADLTQESSTNQKIGGSVQAPPPSKALIPKLKSTLRGNSATIGVLKSPDVKRKINHVSWP